MEIDDLFAFLRKNELPFDALERRFIQARVDDYKMQADLKRYKRVLERDSEEETEPDKKSKVDFKYINLERLTFKTILRGFIDWKADITNLFAASLSKFRGDPLKLIAAQQYMDGKAKTLWRTHV